MAEHNERFACEPAAGADFHRALPRGTELRGVFCFEYERVVSNDRVVRFENRCLQLKPKRNQGVGAGARVTVQQWCGQRTLLLPCRRGHFYCLLAHGQFVT